VRPPGLSVLDTCVDLRRRKERGHKPGARRKNFDHVDCAGEDDASSRRACCKNVSRIASSFVIVAAPA
jgi:hypothetical protein